MNYWERGKLLGPSDVIEIIYVLAQFFRALHSLKV